MTTTWPLKLYGLRDVEITAPLADLEPGLLEALLVAPAAEPIFAGTIADLYGLDPVRQFSLYGVDPHCDCDPMAFCRNPLHPGPCKGWKRTLGAVAPGALRALEAERVRKANDRRQAAIKRYTDAGKKVPSRLKKPITAQSLNQGQAGAGGAVITGKPSAPTSQQISDKIAARRAEIAKIGTPDFMKKKASERLDVYKTLKDGDIKAMSAAQRNALDGDLSQMVTKFPSQENRDAAKALQTRVNAFPKPATPAPQQASGPRDGDGDGKLNEKRKPGSGSSGGTAKASPVAPSAPLDPNASAAAKTAHAMANRTAPGARVAKKQLEAYSKLTKADFDALPDATKDQIKQDLADAGAKFLDQKKLQALADVRDKLGLAKGPLHVPAAAPATSTPGAEASTPYSRMTDQQLVNGIVMRGTTSAEGKAMVDELAMRGRGPDGKPLTGQSNTPSAPAQAAPAAPAALAAPQVSPASTKAAEMLSRLAALSDGKGLNDAGKARAAEQWEKLDDAGRKRYAEAYADKTLGKIINTLDKQAGVKTNSGALAALRKEAVDVLTDKGDNTPLLDLVGKALERGNTQGRNDLEKRLRQEGLSGAPHAGTEADFEAATNDTDLSAAADRLVAFASKDQAALDEVAERIAADTSKPAWARARVMLAHSKEKAHLGPGSPWTTYAAVDFGAQSPDRRRFASTNDIVEAYAIKPAEEAKFHPVIREALVEARTQGVDNLLTNTSAGSSNRTITMRAVMGGDPGATSVDLTRYEQLPDATKKKFRDSMDHWIDDLVGRRNAGDLQTASAWQSIRDRQDGKKWSDEQEQAIDRAQSSRTTPRSMIQAARAIKKADLDALPEAHAENVLDQLDRLKGNPDSTIAMDAALTKAELEGNVPKYANIRTQNAALHAGVWKDVADTDSKYMAYTDLDTADWAELNPGGRTAVGVSMLDLANDPNNGLTPDERYNVLHKLLKLNGDWANLSMDQKDAIISSRPSNIAKFTEAERIQAYDSLTKAEYDALLPYFRKQIDDDLERLRANNSMTYDRLKSKFDPSYVPPAPVTPPRASAPHIDAALDVVYGVDPKARTAARQLSAYGQLRGHEFNTLSIQERNTILGDLSFIVTTSKSADSKAKAQKLIDRFAPAGTPPGSPAVGSPVPPSNAVAGQTRYPDPAGVPGMLKQAANKGRSGDGWVTGPNGKRVWGKYGAAGLMLRHVDANGTERFLMVERGPGISDPGKWQFPGGAIDSAESAAEGATRETVEELGFKAADLDPARVNGFHESTIPGVMDDNGRPWKYTTLAATVPSMIKPDLSSYHAQQETSDAKWMTRQEIEALDRGGKLLAPIAGGKLQQNVISLFPSAAIAQVSAPGPVTRRPTRLAPGMRGANPSNPPGSTTPYKQRTSTNLVTSQAAAQDLLNRIKGPVRASYRGKTADERFAAINAIQGNDRTPTVMSKAEMDRLLATGDYIEIWRGVGAGGGKTAGEIAEQFRSGSDYGGLGIFGNGYYFAEDKALADYYSGGGWRGSTGGGGLIRALLPKSALTEGIKKIRTEAATMPSSAKSSYQPTRAAMGGATLRDPGRYAAAKGLDGIKLSAADYRGGGGGGSHMVNKPVYNIVNRSILIVQEA